MNERYWVAGVDPGEYGCIAFYRPQIGMQPGELHFIDLRIQHGVDQGKGQKNHASYAELAKAISLFTDFNGRPTLTVVETPHSMPSDGHVGAFTFGKACGMIEGMLHALQMPQIAVVPSVWKAQMNLSSVKAKSIALAQEKFKDCMIPQGIEMFTTPKRYADGRAEAALLAWMAAHKLGRK